MSDLDRLKKIMVSQDIDISDERFTRAFRIFENPSGCELCGARTKVAHVIPAKGKTPSYMKSACCGVKVG